MTESFNNFGLHSDLIRSIDNLGFTKPTPVQADAIPLAIQGRDLLACAMTGSGKTAAFALPIIHRLHAAAGAPRGRTRALILSPTRELAAQTHEHISALAQHTRIRSAAIYGGVGMKPQEDALRRGVDIVAATPGRLLDHMQHDYARLEHIEILVLDEADRMLDMGFLPDIRRVLRALPARARQTMLFSATMPSAIAELSREILSNPARINVERKAGPAKGITQALYPVPSALKPKLLIELLNRNEIGNAIIFCRTKHRANRLFEKLEKAGFTAGRIHGNRSQSQRTDALSGFKTGRYRVLVATDIVARGIDVEALEHVVNFDVPNVAEDYIHRVGRTARADATGDAYTFVSPEEENDMRAIERAVGLRIERRTLKDFDYRAPVEDRLEIPIAERIAEIRARKREERERAKINAERRARNVAGGGESRGTPARSGTVSRAGTASRAAGTSQPAGTTSQHAGNTSRAAGSTSHAGTTSRMTGRTSRPEQDGRQTGSSNRRRRRGGRGRGPSTGSSAA